MNTPLIVAGGAAILFNAFTKKKATVPEIFDANVLQWRDTVLKYQRFPIPTYSTNDFLAMIAVESAGNPSATNNSGEIGLMQVTPIGFIDAQEHWNLPYIHEDLNYSTDYQVESGMSLMYKIDTWTNLTFEEKIKTYNAGIGVTRAVQRGDRDYTQTTKDHWARFLRWKDSLELAGV